jgi:hypothetical protein
MYRNNMGQLSHASSTGSTRKVSQKEVIIPVYYVYIKNIQTSDVYYIKEVKGNRDLIYAYVNLLELINEKL